MIKVLTKYRTFTLKYVAYFYHNVQTDPKMIKKERKKGTND